MSTKKLTEDELYQTIKRKNILIVVLFLLFIAAAYFCYESNNVKSNDHHFVGGVPEPTADDAVHSHRGRFTPFRTKALGVWYDTASIRKYLDSTYKEIVDRQTAYIKSKGIIKISDSDWNWKVGFYWMMKHVGSKKNRGMQEDFFVVPVLVKKDSVLDYFDDKKKVYDHHTNDSKGTGKVYNITDEGNVWP